ncbi:hypothetical protein BX600DRAFT_451066 [Xylariales sp. PMI_506]|nr:hypothetical protein BX600DRAFT_451066 [Xylariales sp. PMI_506]
MLRNINIFIFTVVSASRFEAEALSVAMDSQRLIAKAPKLSKSYGFRIVVEQLTISAIALRHSCIRRQVEKTNLCPIMEHSIGSYVFITSRLPHFSRITQTSYRLGMFEKLPIAQSYPSVKNSWLTCTYFGLVVWFEISRLEICSRYSAQLVLQKLAIKFLCARCCFAVWTTAYDTLRCACMIIPR